MSEIKLKDLKKEIPYRWRLDHKSKDGKKGAFLAYIDARDAMDLLDKVVGAGNWKDDYFEAYETIYCTVSIKVGDEWVSKSDTGAWGKIKAKPDDLKALRSEAKLKDKTIASDAFKRACVKWGIGRFLYDLEIKWMDIDEWGKPINGSPEENLSTEKPTTKKPAVKKVTEVKDKVFQCALCPDMNVPKNVAEFTEDRNGKVICYNCQDKIKAKEIDVDGNEIKEGYGEHQAEIKDEGDGELPF